MRSPCLVSWTVTISSFIRAGNAELALNAFYSMCHSGLHPNEFSLSLALKATRIIAKPIAGRLIHGYTIKSGLERCDYCSTSILDMYSKLGCMNEARTLFNSIPQKCDAFWNTLIDGYARCPDENEAVSLFHRMLLSCAAPNSVTYTILVKLSADAADIGLLRFFHARTVKAGFDRSNFVGGALVDAYGKWTELDDAVRTFWSLEERDRVVWTALLAGFRNNGDAEQGVSLYLRYVSEGYRLDPFMFATIFNLCSDLKSIGFGSQVHSCLAKTPFVVDSFVNTALVGMYASSGMVDDAYRVFLENEEKNEVMFCAMINGFVYDSDHKSAVALLYEMRKLGLRPDHSALSSIAKAWTSLGVSEECRVFHGQILKLIGQPDLVTGNNLIEMYAKCEDAGYAENVFVSMEARNEFSWTALISAYNESERYEEALNSYQKMASSGLIEPNEFTLVAALHAVSKLQELLKGKQIHSFIVKKGFQSHAYNESALIGMYSKCGSMDDANRIFSDMSERDIVSWSYMIASYAQRGHGEKALTLLAEYENGPVSIDESIFSSCLSACSSLAALEMGRTIHAAAVKTGFESDMQVGAGIIDMYCKCGCIKQAREFFDGMREHSVVPCTAMICGYAQHGLGWEALAVFDAMIRAGVKPDGVTFVGVLSACSHCGLTKEGWEVFESVSAGYGLEKTVSHYACMVDLLGRAGKVREAKELIVEAPFRSKTLLWRTLLGACSKYGSVEEGNIIAEMLMKQEPDEPANYVMLANIYSSASMWEQSTELKNKMEKGFLKKKPGHSWISSSS